MLKIKNSLSYKQCPGKRCHASDFWGRLVIFIVAFLVGLCHSLWWVPPREGGGVIIGLLCICWAGLPLACLLCICRPMCALGEDRFYFFRSRVERTKSTTRKSRRVEQASGWLLYSDIREITFVRGRPRRSYASRTPVEWEPAHIVIHGEDFTVTVQVGRRVWRLLEAHCLLSCPRQDTAEKAPTEESPQTGLWGELLAAFESGRLEHILPPEWVLDSCIHDADTDMIDLILRCDKETLCINLDGESVYVDHGLDEEDEILPLSHFADIEALYAYLRKCAEQLCRG